MSNNMDRFSAEDYSFQPTVTIKDGSKAAGDVIIPSEIDGSRLIGIEERAFFKNHEITSVLIQSRLSNISSSAFADCSKLREVNIHHCDFIAPGAFFECDRLEKVYINYAGYISESAFGSCRKLAEVVIGTARGIDTNAFDKRKSIMFYTSGNEGDENAVTRLAEAQGYQYGKLNFFIDRSQTEVFDCTRYHYDGYCLDIAAPSDDVWATLLFELFRIFRKYNSKVFRLDEEYYAVARNGKDAEEYEIIALCDEHGEYGIEESE